MPILIENSSLNAFRIQFIDTLRELTNPVDLQTAATELLGKCMSANRAGFADIVEDAREVRIAHTYTHGICHVEGTFRFEDFGVPLLSILQSGQPNIINDIDTQEGITEAGKEKYKALDVKAAIGIPIVRNGNLKAVLFFHMRDAHQWTTGEISFCKEMAQRTWDFLRRARAEEALRKSEEQYYQLFNAMDEGYCVIEMLFDENNKALDYRFVEVNAAFERHTGIPDAAGKWMRTIAPDLEQYWFDIYGHIALTGEPMRFENEARVLGYFYDVYAFRFGKPEEKKVAVKFRDISEQLAAERQREDFVAIASHELKTPVTTIKAYAEIVQFTLNEKGLTDEAAYLDILRQQIERLVKLINSLLDSTRVKENNMHLHLQIFNLNKLVEEQCAYLQLATSTHLLVFEPAPQAVVVKADKERVRQVINNLLSNAIKYSPGTEQRIQIHCHQQEDGYAYVSVRDYGIGIPAELKDKIFERFFRTVHARSNGFPGLGLGLYITSNIIHQHGGNIWVESEGGKGSTFCFTLPAFNTIVAL